MPRNKDLKRLVRARMSKTGESYTASRAKIVARSVKAQPTAVVTEPIAPAPARGMGFAALAGTADTTIKARTGRTWEQWVDALDGDGAHRMAHRDIAALVSSKYKVGPWWGQMVTVGYERIKGLRARGQRRDGTFEAHKSRTFNVPVSSLFEAWADARLRGRWLDATIGRIRTSTPHKSMRLDGRDRSIVAVWFMAKGPAKSAVAVQHTKLRDLDTANELKQYWSERLAALARVLR